LLLIVVIVDVSDAEVLDEEEEECEGAELVASVSNPLVLSMMAAAIPFGLKWMAGLFASSCFRRSSSSARDGSLKGKVPLPAVSLSLLLLMVEWRRRECVKKEKKGGAENRKRSCNSLCGGLLFGLIIRLSAHSSSLDFLCFSAPSHHL
jgi:hypothetical protein